MKKIEADLFADYYEALNGYTPFPWQIRLARQVTKTGQWPDVLDLPTGTGKTSVIDIALFALALFPERFPRRILMVIDRRVIVDQAAQHASRILSRIHNARTGILATVAEFLRSCWAAPASEPPFMVAVLRGGLPRENNWAKRPDMPVVALSTVDQVGSRLLFGGYGVSSGMAPVHAGLLGNDAIYFLDEVHLSIPFAETLDAVRKRWRCRSEVTLPDRFAVVQMSATHRPTLNETNVFGLDDDDKHNETLSLRLRARKPAKMELVNTTGKEEHKKKLTFAKNCVDKATALLDSGAKTVAIIVNRVETACLAMSILAANKEIDGCLMTGRMRPLDRDAVLNEGMIKRLASGRQRNNDSKPLVVVATQCIEAGADFDFDALVTECASLDALRQRFGRLDRLGQLPPAKSERAYILARKDQVNENSEDPVYGDALAKTWQWLWENRSNLDMGLDYFSLPEPKILSQLLAPRLSAPVLLPDHIDRWCQTRPQPWPIPEIALWLHGQRQSLPEAQILWRADITEDQLAECQHNQDRLNNIATLLSACPPGSPETLSLPVYSIRSWLQKQSTEMLDLPDVEGASVTDTTDQPGTKPGRLAVRWTVDGAEIVDSKNIASGDTLVVPAAYGGLKWYNWSPETEAPVADLGDIVQWQMRGKSTLRMHPSIISQWMPKHPPLPCVPGESDPDSNPKESVMDWIHAVTHQTAAGPWKEILKQIASGHRRIGLADNTWILIANKRLLKNKDFENASGSEDEESFVETEISLQSHCNKVKQFAIKFAEAIGLPEPIVQDIGIAAWLHDLGKADPRFQKLLVGGSEVRLALLDHPIAKSRLSSRDRVSNTEARRRSEYPKGHRHELLSIAMIQKCKKALANANDPELVLYLIQTHHGYCRPFAPPVTDPAPVQVALTHGDLNFSVSSDHGLARLDSGIVDRFWRMNRKYGWWGIAGLEAILRLADHRASEMEGKRE